MPYCYFRGILSRAGYFSRKHNITRSAQKNQENKKLLRFRKLGLRLRWNLKRGGVEEEKERVRRGHQSHIIWGKEHFLIAPV